jgi:hypothetical protein
LKTSKNETGIILNPNIQGGRKMKKNNFKSLAAVLSLAMAATALPVNINAAAAPKLTVSADKVYSGQTYKMTVKNLKKGYTVQFSSTQGGVKFKTKKITAKGAKVTGKFTVKAAKQIADGSATKIKAVVKNENGKKVKSLSKKVTLKQLAKSLTVKDVTETTVTVGTTVNADATIAPAAAKGAYKKVFTSSDSSVLKVVNASNGAFEAVAPGTATITVTATNDDGVVVEGSKSITITVVEAQADNNTTTDNTTTDNTTTDNTATDTPAIVTDYVLELAASKTQITANSKDQATIDITLTAPTESTATKDMLVTAQLVLGTTNIGSLSQEDVTLTYSEADNKWHGQVVFTSATLQNTVKSTIKATISRTVNQPEGDQIVGVNSNEVGLELIPETVTASSSVSVKATKAVVESADRIMITFSEPVSASDFLTYDGKVANGEHDDVVNGSTIVSNAQYFSLLVKRDASDEDTLSKLQDNNKLVDYTKNIAAVLQTSSDTLTFVLKNSKKCIFNVNSRYVMQFVDKHTSTSVASDELSGYFTDTTTPTIMSVEEVSKKKIKVTFDQPVVMVEGGYTNTSASEDNAVASGEELTAKDYPRLASGASVDATVLANYTIDGYKLTEEVTYTGSDRKTYSRFGEGVTVTPVSNIERNAVYIELGKATKGVNSGKQVYFSAGNHIITVSNVGDYASLSANGTNNAIISKTLDFTISEDTTAPSYKVEAQSPEQYIISFTTPLTNLNSYAVGEEVPATALGLSLYYKDTASNLDNDANKKTGYQYTTDTLPTNGFVPATDAYHSVQNWTGWSIDKYAFGGLGQTFKVTRIENTADDLPRVKVEVTQDWTQLDDYKNWRKLYDSYTLAIDVAADGLTNDNNGVTNTAAIQQQIGKIAYDSTSPTIKEITPVVVKNHSAFDVVFSEPVQAGNDVFNAEYGYARTPKYNSITKKTEDLYEMSVKIQNNTTKKVYDTEILGYSTLEDNTIRVQTESLPAGSYTLYATSVSDDAGNTCETVSQTFTIEADAAAAETFKVLSIFADMGYDDNTSSSERGSSMLDADKSDTRKDAIYVEFSSAPITAPMINSVLNTANWTINGVALPAGTKIESGVMNADAHVENNQTPVATVGQDGIVMNSVTIILPDGTLTGINSTSVKLNSNVVNENNVAISGQTTFATPSIFQGSRYASDYTYDNKVQGNVIVYRKDNGTVSKVNDPNETAYDSNNRVNYYVYKNENLKVNE